MAETAIELKNVTKRFGDVVANDHINLTLKHGEILALLGENGSGKTTLMNMLAGIYFPDEGEIFVNGHEVTIRSPKESHALGLGMIHQHFKLIDVLTAAQNIVLGMDGPVKMDMKALTKDIRHVCERDGFELDLDKKIYEMSVSEKQTTEIVKALYRGADILILDEPTAVLTPQETEKLFSALRKMKDNGKSIIIITHKLNEVMEISDQVTVLRKGKFAGTINTIDADEQTLAEMMVGDKVDLNIERTEVSAPEDKVEVRGITVRNNEGLKTLDNVSFTAHTGEILGIAGTSGSGQRELLEAIA